MADSFWSEPPIAIAHRGGAAAFGADKYKVENTLEAFSKAIELGYRYLELDVMKTADNEVVVLHVASSKFEAGLRLKDAPSPAKLQKMDYKELKIYLGREVPTLGSLLKRFQKAKFFVDAKTDEVVQPLAGLVKDSNANDRVVIGSFSPERLVKAHEILGSKARLNLNISQLPLKFHQDERFLKSHKCIKSVHLPYIWASRRRVEGLQRLNLKVLAWTPNTERAIKKAIGAGADGIITDNIILLKTILRF